MRILLLSAAFALAALPAAASSIQNISGTADYADSIKTISCPTCIEPKKVAVKGYVVPKLNRDVVNVEIRDDKGIKDVVRIDKFLGGSPVLFVLKDQAALLEDMRTANRKIAEEKLAAAAARLETIDQAVAEIQPPDIRDGQHKVGIDRETTAAVASMAPQVPKANEISNATPTKIEAPFDPAKLELRIN
jgi:hypothetical protein